MPEEPRNPFILGSCSARRYMIWAFAAASRISPSSSAALQRISGTVESQASAFTIGELTQVLRSYARAGSLGSEGILTSLGPQLRLRAQEVRPDQAILAARSISTMGGPGGETLTSSRSLLLKGLAAPLASHFAGPSCSPRLLCLAVKAYSYRAVSSPDLFEAISAKAATCAADFDGRQMADTLEAFRVLGYRAPDMFAAFERRLVSGTPPFPPNSLRPRDIASVARSFAQLGHGSSAIAVALQHLLLDVLEVGDSDLSPSDKALIQDAFAMHSDCIQEPAKPQRSAQVPASNTSTDSEHT